MLDEGPSVDGDSGATRSVASTSSVGRIAAVFRPLLVVAVAGALAAWVAVGEATVTPLAEYRVRALAVVLVGVAAVGFWLGARRHRTWGFELVPGAAGAVAAMALIGSLSGTPFGPGGLRGDQVFRTAAVTRFADSWQNADFTSQGLPSFYPPGYFWVLGRLAALADVDPWRMLKIGAIVTALAVPMLAFVLWRRVVDDRVAALVSVVAVIVENHYEPYSWLVIVAFVPWWLEVVHGVRRSGKPPGSTVLLGLLGALMLMTYWYFFAVGVVALVVKVVAERLVGGIDRPQLVRSARIIGVAFIGSAIYWLPLVVSVLSADHTESLGNRWFSPSHPELPMPMFEATLLGGLSLVGVMYLAWAYGKDPVARALAVLLVAAYGWYLIGAAAALADRPLLSFRGKALIPVVLATAGVVAGVKLFEFAVSRWQRAEVARVGVALGVLMGVAVGQSFIDDMRDSEYNESARAAVSDAAEPSAAAMQRTIESRVGSRAVLVTDRVDILALYPNYAFVVWNAHYANPASEFSQRIAFLEELSRIDDPATLRALAQENTFDRIDAFVLRDDGDTFVFEYGADAFPNGTLMTEIHFPATLFETFEQVPLGDHVLVIVK